MRNALLLAALALLSGCAMPEARVRAGLVEAGLSEPLAACMAERMVDRLSLMQLRRIADLKHAGRADSLDAFLHRVRSLRDPEIWTVTSSSAALCAFAR
jgi:type IV pilus biogenesis protein CpaD/CtpE